MTTRRQRWEVLDAATATVLSPPYYAGGAAVKVARGLWEREHRACIVYRNGREWQRFGVGPSADVAPYPKWG